MGTGIVMSPDVIKVGAVSERVLGDDVDIAPVKIWITLVFGSCETFAKNKVRGTKTARIRAAEQNSVLIHLFIDFERWGKHVVAEPIAKQVAALLVVGPIVEGRSERKD